MKELKMIDLSAEVAHHMVKYPSSYLPEVEIVQTASHHPHCRSAQVIKMGTHISTHVDAPYHANPKGKTIAEISPDVLLGPAHIVRMPLKTKSHPIDRSDLEGFSNLGKHKRLMLDTGWSNEKWGTTEYFTEGPYLTKSATDFLADLPNLILLGMDFPNIDRVEDTVMGKPAPNHQILLGRGLVMIENLLHLNQVDEDFLLSANPIRLVGGDGCPTRAIAVFPLETLAQIGNS